jgi:hypothetical protein
MYKIKRASGSAFPCIFSDNFRPTISKAASALHWNICREDHGASPSLWKEYYRKTRQTIQVGSGNLHVGKLNQMSQEKNISNYGFKLFTLELKNN